MTDALSNATLYEYDCVGSLTAVTDAEGQTVRFEYDDAGNVVKTIYPDDTFDLAEYDRVTQVKYDGTTVYRYTYDGSGDLYSAEDVLLGFTIYYEYDHAGRCMASTTKNSNGAILASYKYEYNAFPSFRHCIAILQQQEYKKTTQTDRLLYWS